MAAVMPGKAGARAGHQRRGTGQRVIMWPPVSVCQKVSTMGQRSPPTCLCTTSRLGVDGLAHRAQQTQAGQVQFFGCTLGSESAALISERMAVGAV
jgi:hypothetical protein